jgi:hypothetical protein
MLTPKKPIEDSYYERYKDYFTYLPLSNRYEYHIKLKYDQKKKEQAPVFCPKCSANTKENPPVKYPINLNISLPLLQIAMIMLSLILIIISLSIQKNVFLICAIALFLITTLSTVISVRKQNIYILSCPVCKSVIFDNIPEVFIVSERPKVVFEKLEKIPNINL